MDGGDAESEHSESTRFPLPEQVNSLSEFLLKGYSCPSDPPVTPPEALDLTSAQLLTLKHYVAWYKSNGTVQAYKMHARVLQDASGETILSLYMARKLAVQISKLSPTKVDICPRSCIAYTGEFENLDACPFICDRELW